MSLLKKKYVFPWPQRRNDNFVLLSREHFNPGPIPDGKGRGGKRNEGLLLFFFVCFFCRKRGIFLALFSCFSCGRCAGVFVNAPPVSTWLHRVVSEGSPRRDRVYSTRTAVFSFFVVPFLTPLGSETALFSPIFRNKSGTQRRCGNTAKKKAGRCLSRSRVGPFFCFFRRSRDKKISSAIVVDWNGTSSFRRTRVADECDAGAPFFFGFLSLFVLFFKMASAAGGAVDTWQSFRFCFVVSFLSAPKWKRSHRAPNLLLLLLLLLRRRRFGQSRRDEKQDNNNSNKNSNNNNSVP